MAFAGVVVLALAIGLLGGSAGNSREAATAAGIALMAAIAIPSVMALKWGRDKSHQKLMMALGGVFFAKALGVGGALVYVWRETALPHLPFVFGLMAGWVLSFAAQALVLRRTLPGGTDS